MFISVELSSTDPEATSVVTRPVLKLLQAIDDPTYADMRGRAFLEDAGAPFMDAFTKVVDREVERNASIDAEPVRTNPLSLHRPRHDVESIWWVAFWALIRASPFPRCEEEDTGSHTALCTVPDSMLDWNCFGNDMARRARYLVDPPIKALHPALRRYGSLLKDMAMYIAMPWHLYDETVPPTHAHSAFLHMLLSEICISGGDNETHILLDTTKPRSATHTHWLEVYARDLSVVDALPGSLPDASESPSRQFAYATAGIAAVIPSKRTLGECDSDALGSPRKRLRAEAWARPEREEEDKPDDRRRSQDDRQARP